MNFLVKFLEGNEEFVHDMKSSIIDESTFHPWIYKNVGILVILSNVMLTGLVFAVNVLSIFIFPILGGINALYRLGRFILSAPYFNRVHIKKSLKEYELSLNEKSVYYLKDRYEKYEFVLMESNLRDFLIYFFKRYNGMYDTRDKESGILICRPNRRRSIGDLYLICKNHFPDTNLNDLIRCLIKLNEDGILAVSKCSEIKKYVFVAKDSYTNNYYNKDLEFIHGVSFKQLIAYYERNGGLP